MLEIAASVARPRTAQLASHVVHARTERPASGAAVSVGTPTFSPFAASRTAPPIPRVLTGADWPFVDMGSFNLTAAKPSYPRQAARLAVVLGTVVELIESIALFGSSALFEASRTSVMDEFLVIARIAACGASPYPSTATSEESLARTCGVVIAEI